MPASALETEARRILASLRAHLRESDRAVVVAFVLSLVPFPLTSVMAAVISLLNLLLIATGRLSRANLTLVLAALMFSALSAGLFFYFFGDLMREFLAQAARLVGRILALPQDLMRSLEAMPGGHQPGAEPIRSSDI